jgi:mannosyltransferase OCH1-like enzyme
MLHKINLNEYNFNNCKFIVIKNSLDIDFKFNNKVIKPNQQIFKSYSNEILTLETEFNIDIKTLGFIILINIYKTTIITKDFFLYCGSIKSIYKDVKLIEPYINNEFVSMFILTIIEVLELHYKYHNIYDQEISKINYIPLNIHFIWLKKNNDSKFVTGYYKSWLNNHPNHQIYFWTDYNTTEIPEEILNNKQIIVKYKQDIFKLLNKYKSDFKNAIDIFFKIQLLGGKSDILRYLILYDIGGLYVDINDFECFKSTEQLFYQYDFVVGAETCFADLEDLIFINNAFIMSKKEHLIIKRLLENMNPNNYIINYNDVWYEQDDSLANITGVCVFRNIVLGYLLDPTIKDKTKYIVLPSIFIYPSCFYTEHNYHVINYKDNKDKWLHSESFATHYSQRSYLLD